jgi:outer membrane protein assembly factor BamA
VAAAAAFCCLFSGAMAQFLSDSAGAGMPVRSIEVVGNASTRAEVILREMETRVGGPFSPGIAEADRKRIQGLGLFNRVEVLAVPDADAVRCIVLVTERWALIPYPVLHRNDRDWSKWSYGAGLRHINVRGRAERLDLLASAGYNPVARMVYENPWFGGPLRLQAGFGVAFKQVLSRHFTDATVQERHIAGSGRFGKRFGLFFSANAVFGYREVRLSPGVFDGLRFRKDRIPFLGGVFLYDRRDLKEYAGRGFFIYLSALQNGLPGSSPDYARFEADIRSYLPVGRSVCIAVRNATGLSSGPVPVHDRLYFGYEERIRGHFFDTAEGENRHLAAVAVRFPVLPVRYFDLGDDPGASDLKFGISAGLFAETGVVWSQGDRLQARRLNSGYGAGLHFHLPYVDVLRVESAFDEQGRHQWIVDIGADI